MLAAAFAALHQIFSPPFRAVLAKSLSATIAMLALAGLGLHALFLSWTNVTNAWLRWTVETFAGLGLFVGLVFLVAPVTCFIVGFFLDDLALRVEREISPAAVGKPLPTGQSVWLATKFAALSLLVNLCALLLLLVPLVNVVAFFAANAYLLSREYFELAALRHRPVEEARAMRRAHRLYILACGLFLAAMVAVPIVNLLTPLFGVAFMVRIHQRLSRSA